MANQANKIGAKVNPKVNVDGSKKILDRSLEQLTKEGESKLKRIVTGGGGASSIITASGWAVGDIVDCSAGTEKDIDIITGLADSYTEIKIFFNQVSTDANTQAIRLNVGTNASYATSGYLCSFNSGSAGNTEYTDGWWMTIHAQMDDADAYTGIFTLHRWDTSQHFWYGEGMGHVTSDISPKKQVGYITLGDALTRVKITTPDGTANFDSGNIRAFYH